MRITSSPTSARRWSEVDSIEDPSLWPYSKVFHGVIGLRTKLSGGNATVADYAAAAAGLNLQFLVFLEPSVAAPCFNAHC